MSRLDGNPYAKKSEDQSSWTLLGTLRSRQARANVPGIAEAPKNVEELLARLGDPAEEDDIYESAVVYDPMVMRPQVDTVEFTRLKHRRYKADSDEDSEGEEAAPAAAAPTAANMFLWDERNRGQQQAASSMDENHAIERERARRLGRASVVVGLADQLRSSGGTPGAQRVDLGNSAMLFSEASEKAAKADGASQRAAYDGAVAPKQGTFWGGLVEGLSQLSLSQGGFDPARDLKPGMSLSDVLHLVAYRLAVGEPEETERALDRFVQLAEAEVVIREGCGVRRLEGGLSESVVWRHPALLSALLDLTAHPRMQRRLEVGRAMCELVSVSCAGSNERASERRQRCVANGGIAMVLAALNLGLARTPKAAQARASSDDHRPTLAAPAAAPPTTNTLLESDDELVKVPTAAPPSGSAWARHVVSHKHKTEPGHINCYLTEAAGASEVDASGSGLSGALASGLSGIATVGGAITSTATSAASLAAAGVGSVSDGLQRALGGGGDGSAPELELLQPSEARHLIAACHALSVVCMGFDEAAHQRKALAIDLHALESLIEVTRLSASERPLLPSVLRLTITLWTDMLYFQHPSEHDDSADLRGNQQSRGRRRRAIKRLALGAAQFDAVCKVAKLHARSSEAVAADALEALATLLPCVLYCASTRVSCVVRAALVQQLAKDCTAAHPHSKLVQARADKVQDANFVLRIKAAIKKTQTWRQRAQGF